MHEWKAPYVKYNCPALKNKLATSDSISSRLAQVTSCPLKACLSGQWSSRQDGGMFSLS